MSRQEVTSYKRGAPGQEEEECLELVHLFNNLKCFDSIYLNNVLIDIEFKASQSISDSDISLRDLLLDYMEADNANDADRSDSSDTDSQHSVLSAGVEEPDSLGD